LCNRTVLLKDGEVVLDGSPRDVINSYISEGNNSSIIDLETLPHKGPGRFIHLKKLTLMDYMGKTSLTFMMGEPLVAQIELFCKEPLEKPEIGLKISSIQGIAIHYLTSTWEGLQINLERGRYLFEVSLPELILYPGKYWVGLWASKSGEWSDDNVQGITMFEVVKDEKSQYPAGVSRYAYSGCEVYVSSKWRLME
ncbi:MAG: Wzt carbohydrate-binding domain-containing protein, partial [Desulfobacterales bacterium]|nr:Wzt carbohydrate-binding domain-containing protein [Desulfobacterales bacterium]